MESGTQACFRDTDPDGQSITDVYEVVAPALRRFAASRVRDPEAADDIVQEAFVRLSIEYRANRKPDQPKAWLFRVVLNLIISSARHAAVERRYAGRMAFDEADASSPEIRFLSIEYGRALKTALAAADADGSAGILLAASGYSGREIARRIGRSEGATRTLLSRTRRSIRHELTTAYTDVA